MTFDSLVIEQLQIADAVQQKQELLEELELLEEAYVISQTHCDLKEIQHKIETVRNELAELQAHFHKVTTEMIATFKASSCIAQ